MGLRAAIAERWKTATAFAQWAGVGKSAVGHWLHQGVPLDLCIRICRECPSVRIETLNTSIDWAGLREVMKRG